MSSSENGIATECAERGRSLIDWSERRMPALSYLRGEFERSRTLDGIRIAGSLHLTPETGALARCLKGAGAAVVLCGSNPLSTRDEICAALTSLDGIPTHASYGETRESYRRDAPARDGARRGAALPGGRAQ